MISSPAGSGISRHLSYLEVLSLNLAQASLSIEQKAA